MGDETGVVPEAFPALQAPGGLLSSMGSLVGIEVGALTKTVSTLKTCVGRLPCVGSWVGHEVASPATVFDPRVTPVGFLCEVQALMVNEFFQVFLRGTLFPQGSTPPLPFIFILIVLPPIRRLANGFCGIFWQIAKNILL